MIFPNSAVFEVMDWIASRIGLDLGLGEDDVLDALDEEEVVEQLQFGRD